MDNEDFLNYMNSREYKISTIRILHYKGFDDFEEAAYESTQRLQTELEELNHDFEEEQQRIEEVRDSEEGKIRSLDEQEDLYMYLIEISGEQQLKLNQLLALSEMQIIYMFKNLEIFMKTLIKTAYPHTKTNDFYKWDNMVLYFKNVGINITELDGYQECTQLKKVNNSIKHSTELSEELKKIPEFNNLLNLTFLEINLFYDRVKPKIVLFFNKLNEAVVDDLFMFSDERIDTLATSLIDRMDKEAAAKFVEALTNKLQP